MNEPSPRAFPDTSPDPQTREEPLPAAGHALPAADWEAVVARAAEVLAESEEPESDAEADRRGGWLRGAPAGIAPVVNIPNTVKHNGISGIPTQLLVLHSAECPLRGGFARSLTEWANVPLSAGGPVASWQRFVDPIARVRMVPDVYAAWHASEANPMSIGWEQAGYAAYTRAQWETPEGLKQMESLAFDMAEVAVRDGIPPVWLRTDQVTAITTHGDRRTKGFCIHAQIDPETRTDPGGGYPYDRLMGRIKFHINQLTGNTPEPTPTEEPFMTDAQYQNVMRELGNIKAILAAPTGYTWNGQHFPSLAAVDIVNQREIRALPEQVALAVASGIKVTRGGRRVDWVQDTADGTTAATQNLQLLMDLNEIVANIPGVNVDPVQLPAAEEVTVEVDMPAAEEEPRGSAPAGFDPGSAPREVAATPGEED